MTEPKDRQIETTVNELHDRTELLLQQIRHLRLIGQAFRNQVDSTLAMVERELDRMDATVRGRPPKGFPPLEGGPYGHD